MMKSAKAFGGTKVYEVSVPCPCRECDLRGYGCARLCDAYKKYKFVLAVLNGVRRAKAKKVRASRAMRGDRIAEWNHNKCWPRG